MSTSSFRARELEALRMELRRELRMEANVFAEDDDFDATDDDDGDDAVVGTPARSRAARRLTSASKGTSRPSSRAFQSPSRSLRVDDFKDALSPMRGLGSAPVAEKEKKGPSRRRRDVDVVATPTRSEAPPARSALLSDRLVLAPPSATRGRDRARPEVSERRERLRSPSLERLAGTYRSLGALATAATYLTPAKGEGSAKVSVSARGSVSVSSSAAKKSSSRASVNGRARDVPAKTYRFAHRGGRDVKDARPVSRSRFVEAERAPILDARRGKDTAEKELLTRKDAERRGKTRSASVSKPKSLPGTKLDAKKPVTGQTDHDYRPERRREPHANPTRWRTVVEYDLNGRRVERKTLAPPPSARGRPAWSSATRPGTSSGPAASRSAHNAKHKNETASKALRPATSAGVSRPASRPAFDPGPGGLGIDHRAIITEKFSRASKNAFLTPRRERRADASRRVRSPETRSPVRYRRATPSPAPPRRRRETREARETCFSSDDDERSEEKPRRRRVDATSEPSRRGATDSESDFEFESELDSERDVDEGGRKRAEEPHATRDGDGDGGVFGRNPKHPKHPNPFVHVRDAAGDDSDSEAVFFSSAGLGTGGAIRERFVGDSGRPATARSRVRTPSTSGRRAALGGFEGYGSAFGYRSQARRSYSSSQEIARRPYTADTAAPRRDENEARGYFDSNDSNGESSSFDDIINRAFGMAHVPSPSRFAERRRGVTTEAFSAYGGDYSGNRAGIADQRPRYEQNSAYYEPQPQPQPQPLHPFYPHHDAYAYGQQPLPASYAAAPNAGAPAYHPPHPSGDAYSSRDAWYRAAPPPTGAAASFQRWSHSTGVSSGWGYY